MRAGVRVASDIGGTFTDVVLEVGGALSSLKLPTTHEAPERAVIDGMAELLSSATLGFEDIEVCLHGTTLATNALIERRGARTALLASAGFRDVLEIADEGRYDQYDLYLERTAPLVPRERRYTVPERLDVEGRTVLALDERALEGVAAALRASNVESIAIAFLHAYVDGTHERRAGELLAAACPGLSVTLSSEVCPEAREYERTSTAVANAYVQPLIAGYLANLRDALAERGHTGATLLMTSGGHLASLESARRAPIRLVESGPAGGALLAADIAAVRGEEAILSFDMGGTTAKICLIEDARPSKARRFEIDRRARFMKGSGLPVRIPVIDMVEIGAGGGSTVSLDALGRVAVGPRSAGSRPGPACYGHGGEEATVTDADVLLGRIDPARFAGGRLALHPALAARAMEATLPDRGGEEGAAVVAEIVDENMANAARVHAVERGVALSERTLVAFGGAAPLHAARLAEKLGIRKILVPTDAGVGSAIGFLGAPAAHEIVRSRYMRLDALDVAAANALLEEIAAEAHDVARTAAAGAALTTRRDAFMRYTGQGHEIPVALPERALDERDVVALRDTFEDTYRRLFRRHIPDAGIEIMSWAVTVSSPPVRRERLPEVVPGEPAEPLGTRRVRDGDAQVEAAVYERHALPGGCRIGGPALVVEPGTSTFVASGFEATVDAGGALLLERREPAAAIEGNDTP